MPALNSNCVWPATVSSTAGAPPRYGTCTISMPVMRANMAAQRWLVEPAPAEA